MCMSPHTSFNSFLLSAVCCTLEEKKNIKKGKKKRKDNVSAIDSYSLRSIVYKRTLTIMMSMQSKVYNAELDYTDKVCSDRCKQ